MVAAMDFEVGAAAAAAAAGGGVPEQLHQVAVAESTHSPEKGCYSTHCYCESEHPGKERRQSCWRCHCCHCSQDLRYSVIIVGMDIFTAVGLTSFKFHLKGANIYVLQVQHFRYKINYVQ